MESILWAVNLCAVVYLCFWAIREDDKKSEEVEHKDVAKSRKYR